MALASIKRLFKCQRQPSGDLAQAPCDESGDRESSASTVAPADADTPVSPPPPASPAMPGGSLHALATGEVTVGDAAVSLDEEVEERLPDVVSIRVAAGQDVTIGPQAGMPVLVSVMTPGGSERSPSDFCCILDVSGSMGAEAKIQGASGATEHHGLSLLDIAKHGVRTIIKMLGPKDRLSIVSFNHEATLILGLTAMNEEGHRLAEDRINNLNPCGGTHIWRGLHMGLESLAAGAKDAARFAHVLLLTDGESLERELILPNLARYKEERNEQLPGTISTFGFGYNIDSRLLVNLANMGDGTYSFIPDAGFVGTVFVNTLSNLLVTLGREAYLNLEPSDGATVIEVLGDQAVDETSWGCRVRLGMLQYGQAKDIVLRMNTSGVEYLTAGAQYLDINGKMLNVEAIDAKPIVRLKAIEPHIFRTRFVDTITECVDLMKRRDSSYQPSIGRNTSGRSASASNLDSPDGSPQMDAVASRPSSKALSSGGSMMQAVASMVSRTSTKKKTAGSPSASGNRLEDQLPVARQLLAKLAKDLQASPFKAESLMPGLLEDICGQTTEAMSNEAYYWKWGRHYMPSLMLAHKCQQCNNFKDAGVQLYGGSLFNELRDQADEIFDKLPAPQPSLARFAGPSGPVPVVSMAAYNDRYAGCVDGACRVRLADGEERRLCDLAKGDRVMAPGGTLAEVVCMVRSSCLEGRSLLVELPCGLRLTPHHPVQVDGAWRFPADLGAPAQDVACEAVYSFVISGAPALLVNGVACVALGHGLQEGAAKHPYFGSRQAMLDVQGLPGFEAGHVDLPAGGYARDPDTGLVCGLVAHV